MFVVKAESDFATKRIEYLYNATKEQKYCDSVFTVRGRCFHVHMVVLSACSEFFGINKGLLSKIFSNFEFEVIEAILEYCYTGEISIDERHYKNLMELANRLEVKIPPKFEKVNLSNCLKVLTLTDDPKLKQRAMGFILKNFETVSAACIKVYATLFFSIPFLFQLHKTQDFLNLPTSTVIEILKSDDLIVPSEENIFNSVKLWVNYDDENRKSDLVQLMSSVRLSLLSTEVLEIYLILVLWRLISTGDFGKELIHELK
ncbi:kelch-like protein 7 [Arctopsyche grandis]|uniref:kelch-like protein 7 n=1 Tax=Arctopsyche grandis TaxID=121162 RepID=UPI00406D8584